jgi:hypothetical protein
MQRSATHQTWTTSYLTSNHGMWIELSLICEVYDGNDSVDQMFGIIETKGRI